MKNSTSLLLLSLSICSMDLNANTPKQTVKGAQDFLSLTLVDKDIYPSQVKMIFDDITSSNGDSNSMGGYAKILDFSPLSNCKSKLSYDTQNLMITISHNRTSFEDSVASLRPDLRVITRPNGVDWSKLIEVKQEKEKVVVRFDNDKQHTIVQLANEDLAARVAFAMKFLQHHCDQAASTGF